MSEHRVPMLGAALRRHGDPARSRDPKVRELVAALADLEVAPPPRADFRAELRAQLVAVTPRLVAEGDAAAKTTADKQVERAPQRRLRIAKPLIAVACVLTAFVMLLGGAVLISRNALPGDALYGIKRASEATEYGLTGGTLDKGKLKLTFAARRIGEVGDLLPKAGAMAPGTGAVADSGAINARTVSLVRDTLGSADNDVRSAAQMLNTYAVRNRNPAALDAITSWTPGQISAMRQIVARIPAGSLHQRALSTLQLLGRAQHRSSALRPELGCSCLDAARADALGPLPCTTVCSSRAPGTPPAPGRSTTHRPGTPTVPSRPGTTTYPSVPGTHPSTSAPPGHPASRPAGTGTNAPPSAVPSTTPITPSVPGLPSLPGLGSVTGSSATKLPISVDSCGLHATVGPIGIGVGGC